MENHSESLHKEHVQIELTELITDDASDQHVLRSSGNALPDQCPADPVPLKPSASYDFLMDAYDFLLCLIPLVLIAKVILCIVASIKDRHHHGAEVDLVSRLTTLLISFNSQVPFPTFDLHWT